MTEPMMDRRTLLSATTLLAASAAAVSAQAQTPAATASAGPKPFAPTPMVLPFDPKTIAGLSEKMLVSHHDNNYVGAVTRLKAIEAQLATLDPATAPNFMLNGLKREELTAWNSMIIHEVYFSCLGAPNRPGAALARAIERDFGSDARWRAEFSALGKALGSLLRDPDRCVAMGQAARKRFAAFTRDAYLDRLLAHFTQVRNQFLRIQPQMDPDRRE